MFTRRSFLKSSALVALAPTVPVFVTRTARAAGSEADRRILVVVQLDGGNDGLNTLVPLKNETYAKLRPKLKIGICGEHGGDPDSVAFCHELALDYVSCSPFRVPIARLAAAQAALGKSAPGEA